MKFTQSRKWKQGSLATGITVLFVVGVILANIVCSLLIDRFDIKIDVTSNKIYELSEQTEEYLENYSAPTTIYVLADETSFRGASEYYAQAYYTIEKYAALNANIKTEYLDYNEHPELAAQFPDATLAQYGVVVSGENGRYKSLGSNDLFQVQDYDSNTGMPTDVLLLAEQAIDSALEYVEGADPVNAVMTSGHQEFEFSTISSLLESSNYDFSEVSLLTGNIPEDTDLVIISSPKNDFSEGEIEKLETYLDNGGDLGKGLVYIANATQTELPNLEQFLSNWGITVNEGTVLELNSRMYYQSELAPFAYVGTENDYVSAIKDTTIEVLVPYLKPMKTNNSADGVTVIEIGSTSNTCVRIKGDEAEDWEPTQDDLESFAYALAGVKTNSSGDGAKSQVVAFASLDMFGYISEPNLNNGELIIGTLNVAADKESSIQIVSKSLQSDLLGVTQFQANFLMIIFMILIPLAVLITGLVIWLRRRNR